MTRIPKLILENGTNTNMTKTQRQIVSLDCEGKLDQVGMVWMLKAQTEQPGRHSTLTGPAPAHTPLGMFFMIIILKSRDIKLDLSSLFNKQ